MLGISLVLEMCFERISAVTSQAGIMFLLSGPVVIFSDMTSRIMASQRWAQIVGFELCARPQGKMGI
jgi:hypothetical protein